jgi:hypothetical protein
MADEDNTENPQTEGESPSGSGDANAGSGKANAEGRKDVNDAVDHIYKMLEGFSRMSTSKADGVSPQVTDAVTQALVAILGTGPSMAAFDSLLSVQAANGMMYYNAVANQQKTNLLGMAMTAKCVRYMLDPDSNENMDEWTGDAE